MMGVHDEEFDTREAPDRLHYAPGVFLDAEDLLAEQTYHRGRLSRVLAYLHGTGTAAGLRVEHDTVTDELRVEPGIAIDRIGRLIEVPRRACLHVGRWFEHQVRIVQNPEDHDEPSGLLQAVTADNAEVVGDIYVRFVVCGRGRTPAFATGPYDSLDATVPHRVRDSYELTLELRGGDTAPLPTNPWPGMNDAEDYETWQTRMHDAVLDSWKLGTNQDFDFHSSPPPDAVGVSDPTAVFLARVRIPVSVPGTGIPQRTLMGGEPPQATIDNYARRFVYSTEALLRWIDSMQGTFDI